MNVAYNQDCMEAMRAMPDGAFDLAVVDPVYGGVTAGGYLTGKSAGGVGPHPKHGAQLWGQLKTGQEYFNELFRVSKNQIIFGGNYFMREIARNSQGWIVWDKCHPEGIKFADAELAWTSFDRATRIFRFLWHGMCQGTPGNGTKMQGDKRKNETRIHPTQKPVALYTWIFSRYAKEGDRILDTHLGSGSSRIAAYDMGLDFVGYEIDPDYFASQEKRFKEHTAQFSIFNTDGGGRKDESDRFVRGMCG